ncbi:ATP-binding protein [Methylomonas sp. ZR1]|uniref:ATP-binding protein n=1 Tax=unclassified Methylomonas TaxID=2608980 RepID=UPI0014913A10|nr:ATP-binding protein [Methylomonas sp. ZR1]NOV28861.1 GAF domain-containing protein [Methylomonas sp. ZR1]
MLLTESQQWDWIYNLYQLGQSDAFEEDTNKIFEKLLRHIVEGFRADTGSLVLYEGEDSSCLTIVAALGLPEECVGSAIPNGNGVIAWVLANQQALLIKGDINKDSRFLRYPPKTKTRIPVASMCWPLQIGQRLIGALSVNSFNDECSYTGADLDHGQKLVNPITLVIDNIRLHGDQRKRIQQLANANQRYANANQQLIEAHKRLNESEKRLNDILNSLDSVVWSMEPVTMKLLYLNKAATEVSGRPVEDFLNDPQLWLNIIDPTDRKQVEASLADLKTNSIQKVIYRIHRPDGGLRWLFHRMCAVCDDAGSPVRIDGITVDITQHKNAEDLLKQRNQELQTALDTIQEVQQQLVQSEKMSSIGQLAAGVAHEINNPIGYINSNLTSLKTYVEDLLALVEKYEKTEGECADGEQLRQIQDFKQQIDLVFLKTDVLDLLVESHEGASRVKKIVQDLKDFSHAGGADDWQWTNLHDCLDSTLNIVNNEIKYKARVVKAYGDIPHAWCLPHQLNQVFMNLLVNAAHAIEKEGTITIRTGSENGTLWVEVSDTGQGILPEHANKIFDPFFTTKPVGKGTGLGLSVSYSIVKKHQGEIKVDSRIGEGTTFRVVLPKKEQPVDL